MLLTVIVLPWGRELFDEELGVIVEFFSVCSEFETALRLINRYISAFDTSFNWIIY